MQYNEYSNPKATAASKRLAQFTLIFALVGIIAAVYVIASGVHSIWGLLIILLVAICVVGRPRIEAVIVARIMQGEEDGPHLQ